jgi:hypothetical protein
VIVFHGRKTYLVALLTLAVGVLAETDWVKVIDDPKGGLGLIAGSIVMAVMRWITEQTTVQAVKAPPTDGE